MGGYLSTSDSWTVSDAAQGGYTGTVTGTLSVTAGTGTSCSWSASISHPSYNYFRIYIAIDGTCVKDEYVKISNTKSSYFSGTADISGDDVSINFGLSASVNSTSTSYMSYKTGTLTRSKWADITAAKPTIVDNGDNSFTITAYASKDATNNAVNSSELEWTIIADNGNWYNDPSTNKYPRKTIPAGGSLTETFDIASYGTAVKTSRKVAAATVIDGTRNDTWSGYEYLDINQYVAPTNPSDVEIIYTKSRLTIKEKWRISWTASTPGNSISPIKGYRIRIQVDGSYIPIKKANGTILSTRSGTDHYYDTNSTQTWLDVFPGIHDIKPGNNVRIYIYAYTENGKKEQVFSGNSKYPAESPLYPVQNAGVVRVKVGNQWKEGIVYTKVGSQWKEADVVYVKNSGKWKESE